MIVNHIGIESLSQQELCPAPFVITRGGVLTYIVNQEWCDSRTMTKHVMFGWTLIEVSVLGSEVFGQASTESCDIIALHSRPVLLCSDFLISDRPIFHNLQGDS